MRDEQLAPVGRSLVGVVRGRLRRRGRGEPAISVAAAAISTSSTSVATVDYADMSDEQARDMDGRPARYAGLPATITPVEQVADLRGLEALAERRGRSTRRPYDPTFDARLEANIAHRRTQVRALALRGLLRVRQPPPVARPCVNLRSPRRRAVRASTRCRSPGRPDAEPADLDPPGAAGLPCVARAT